MRSSTVVVFSALLISVLQAVPMKEPKLARALNQGSMTEEQLKKLLKSHIETINPTLRHNDPVVRRWHVFDFLSPFHYFVYYRFFCVLICYNEIIFTTLAGHDRQRRLPGGDAHRDHWGLLHPRDAQDSIRKEIAPCRGQLG